MTTIPNAEMSTLFCGCQQRHQKSCLEQKLKQRKLVFEATLELLQEAICKVMYICGIPRWKTIAASDTIGRAFTHYDEICYRVDRMPRKRLCKEDLIHDLGVKGSMSRIEAQIGYSIVRRVFKAYYYGTGAQGLAIRSSMRHRAECLWRHAAERTAQVFAVYAGLMHSEQAEYEQRFRCIYKNVHDTLQANDIYDDDIECTCQPQTQMSDDYKRKRSWRSVSLVQDVTESLSHLEVLYRSSRLRFTATLSKISLSTKTFNMATQHSPSTLTSVAASAENFVKSAEPPCGDLDSDDSAASEEEDMLAVVAGLHEEELEETEEKPVGKCNCPALVCARAYDTQPPDITAECSQGPFICRWLPISEEEEPRVLPCREPTPICRPCKSHTSTTPCDSECSCICEWCECNSYAMQMEEAEQRRHYMTSNEGIEDNDTDFTYVAPLRDRPTSSSAIEEEELRAEEECCVEDVECANERQHTTNSPKPEDVNYVAPLKNHATSEEKEEEEEASAEASEEPVKPTKPIIIIKVPGPRPPPPAPKPPPAGISWETAKCWRALKPHRQSDEEEAMSEELARVRRKCRSRTATSQSLKLSNIKLLSSPLAADAAASAAAAAQLMPIVNVKTRHGSSTAAAPASRYADASQPAASVAAAKPPTNANQTPPIANNKTATTAKPSTPPTTQPPQPAAAPAQAKRASVAPTRRSADNEPPLTKEDILNIIGI